MHFDPRNISIIAKRIRNADPRVYEEFVRALDAYSYDLTVAVTMAGSAEILQAQGRAQQALKLLQLVSNPLDGLPPTP